MSQSSDATDRIGAHFFSPRASFSKLFVSFVIGALPCFFQTVHCLHAGDCEILETRMYEKEQNVIVTDWIGGIPYMRYQVEKFPCAHITVRNNFWQSVSTEDITVTATFSDQSTLEKKFGCEKKNLESGAQYSCDMCFESKYPLSALGCSLSPQ